MSGPGQWEGRECIWEIWAMETYQQSATRRKERIYANGLGGDSVVSGEFVTPIFGGCDEKSRVEVV